MLRYKPWAMSLIVMAATIFSLPRLQAADAVSSARRLPSAVHVYFSIPSVPDLKTKWAASTLGQLRDDPALQDFLQDLEAQFDQAAAGVQQQLGVSLEELSNVPSGEVAVAVMQSEGGDLGMVAFLEFGDSRETVDKLLQRTGDELTKKGAKQSQEEVGGTQVTVYTQPADAAAQNPDAKGKTRLAYYQKDGTLVLGSSVPHLETVLARWDGQHERTLADNEQFRYIRERCSVEGSEPVLTWYVNPVGLITAAVASVGRDNLQAQLMLGFLPALGLTKLKAMGGGVDIGVDQYESINKTILYIDFPAEGVLKAFEFPAVEQSPPNWVPVGVSTYMAANWNVPGAFDAIEALVDSFRGPGSVKQALDALADNPEGPQLHVKKDLIDQFNGQVHIVVAPSKVENAEVENGEAAEQPDQFLLAMGLNDPKKMQDVLNTIAETPQFPGKVREFRGQSIYEMPLPPQAGNAGTTAGLTIAQEHLMISNDVRELERVLRGESDQPLARSPEFRRVAEHFPAATSLMGFQKQDRQIETIYELLRSGRAGANVPGLDFSKLPPFEKIEKYFPTAGSYAVPDKNGALFVGFSLRSTER